MKVLLEVARREQVSPRMIASFRQLQKSSEWLTHRFRSPPRELAMNRHGSAAGARCLPPFRPECTWWLGLCGLGNDPRLSFLEERSKLIPPADVARMNLLQRHELLAR